MRSLRSSSRSAYTVVRYNNDAKVRTSVEGPNKTRRIEMCRRGGMGAHLARSGNARGVSECLCDVLCRSCGRVASAGALAQFLPIIACPIANVKSETEASQGDMSLLSLRASRIGALEARGGAQRTRGPSECAKPVPALVLGARRRRRP